MFSKLEKPVSINKLCNDIFRVTGFQLLKWHFFGREMICSNCIGNLFLGQQKSWRWSFRITGLCKLQLITRPGVEGKRLSSDLKGWICWSIPEVYFSLCINQMKKKSHQRGIMLDHFEELWITSLTSLKSSVAHLSILSLISILHFLHQITCLLSTSGNHFSIICI